MMSRFTYIGSSYLFLVKDGKILLQRRFQTGFEDGNYGVPAGHMDGDETPREACARECVEEIGVALRPEDLTVVHTMYRKAANDERIDFFMTASRYEGEVQNLEPHKCDDLQWFPLDALPDNTIDYVRQAIVAHQKGVTYSEYKPAE
jgi:8-oxo-dGTP pyrophosphatase MutT (NUDIX family)